MKLPEFVRSTQFRLALVFGATLTLSTLAIFAYIYFQTAQGEIQHFETFLTYEAQQSVDTPMPLMLEQVRTRIANDLHRNTYSALFDPQEHLIAGNLDSIPSDFPIDGVAHDIVATSPKGNIAPFEQAVIVAIRRADGSILVLGHDLQQVLMLQNLVLVALERGVLPIVLITLLLGVIFGYQITDRVKMVHLTIDRIMSGNMNERLPIEGKNDNLDRISVKVNDMLDEIVDLIDEIRSVGDNIAHDLRTPLSVMQARLERALATRDPDDIHNIVQQALTDLERTLVTITSLLRIAEIENGKRQSFVATTDLAAIADDVYELYEPVAESKGVTFSVTHKAPASVHADHDMLIEAVANLVDNAIKFTPAGGNVRIETGVESNVPVIWVTDSGPGIPPAERSNVTQRFYRLDKNPNIRGSGLGLSVVAAIAKLHGFRLQIADVEQGAALGLICPPHET